MFTCNYVVSIQRGFLSLLVLEKGRAILLWLSLCLPFNYFCICENKGADQLRGNRYTYTSLIRN